MSDDTRKWKLPPRGVFERANGSGTGCRKKLEIANWKLVEFAINTGLRQGRQFSL
jgi:hypothetical protein